MKNKKILPMKISAKKLIKVQLDYKTVITISNMEKLKSWLFRYPEAKVIAS
ncbi:hypothetical protein BH10BAC1_BH10BAC1_04330 [soil metagenome]